MHTQSLCRFMRDWALTACNHQFSKPPPDKQPSWQSQLAQPCRVDCYPNASSSMKLASSPRAITGSDCRNDGWQHLAGSLPNAGPPLLGCLAAFGFRCASKSSGRLGARRRSPFRGAGAYLRFNHRRTHRHLALIFQFSLETQDFAFDQILAMGFHLLALAKKSEALPHRIHFFAPCNAQRDMTWAGGASSTTRTPRPWQYSNSKLGWHARNSSHRRHVHRAEAHRPLVCAY